MTPLDSFGDPGRDTPSGFPSGFRTAVARELRARGFTIVDWVDTGVHVLSSNSPDERYLGLNNLYRRACNAEPADWPRLIREFLDHVSSLRDEPPLPPALDTLTAQLRPRLGPPFSRDLQIRPWSIPLPGTPLVISLVVDFPHAMAYATEEMVCNSQISPEELLECALDNLRHDTPDDFLQPVTEELELLLGHTGDGYDASRALFVEQLVPQESPAGFWLALPSRDELYVWPVSPAGFEHLPHLKLFAQDNYQKHAYPISDEVFWVRDGRWHTFTIRFDTPDSVSITPPPEFIELLEQWTGSGDLDLPL